MTKPCITVEAYTFRFNSELKCQQIPWRCSVNRKKRPAKLRSDKGVTKVLSGILEHDHERCTKPSASC